MRLFLFPTLLVCLAWAVRPETTGAQSRPITLPHERGSPEHAISCANDDSTAASAAVRARLAEWVRQANGNDNEGMREVWAPGLVGWFPRAPIFSDSAALATAGLRNPPTSGGRATFDLIIDYIVAAGSFVVVHDIWTETRRLSPGKTVRRQIRGSELWRCQPDGRWRIARYVSAPEPWTVDR